MHSKALALFEATFFLFLFFFPSFPPDTHVRALRLVRGAHTGINSKNPVHHFQIKCTQAPHPALPVGQRGFARPPPAVRLRSGRKLVQVPDVVPMPFSARHYVQRLPLLPNRTGRRPRGACHQQPSEPRHAKPVRRWHRLLVAHNQHAT